MTLAVSSATRSHGRLRKYSLLAAVLAVAVAGGAQAGTIIGATGATTTMGQQGFAPLNSLIDQSGLNATYVSGSTDFDTFVASALHDSITGSNSWFSSVGVSSGSITFDLGSVQLIDALALWAGHQFQTNALKDFSLFDDSNTLLGSYTALQGPGVPNVSAQVFSFAAASTRFVRMDIANNYGGTLTTGGEIAFDTATAVPAPATLALLATGVVGLAGRRRGRRTSRTVA